ncbi:MAG: hypothetical protein NZ926_00935 [Candidatus Methanomethylicia archaeon]|nr:hypothetical protein [Candidatus Methanomethylicia archaeon]MCX8168997.1 hypothetical protein [Candidatus Methanomethylicia archaeon]MDW7988728.1 hypothetical protein [Nitrososphaerota archaeon]
MNKHPELSYEILKHLERKIKETKDEYYKFTLKGLSRDIGEGYNIKRINTIIKDLINREIVKSYSKGKYYLMSEDVQKLNECIKELENTLMLSYHEPMRRMEPPINIYKIINGEKRLIAQALRKSILKAIYHVKEEDGEVKYKIIFKTYKFTGFTIIKENEKIFEAYRKGFMKPIESVYNGMKMLIKRRWGREILVLNDMNDWIGCMKGCGIEKAIFIYKNEIKEISLPLSTALFAIKQFDVII